MDKETNQLDSIDLRFEIEKALDVGDEEVSDQDVDMISMYRVLLTMRWHLSVVKCLGIIG